MVVPKEGLMEFRVPKLGHSKGGGGRVPKEGRDMNQRDRAAQVCGGLGTCFQSKGLCAPRGRPSSVTS